LHGYLKLPHAQSVFRIERLRQVLGGAPAQPEIVYGVSSLSAARLGARSMLAYNRGHWTIENRLHHVRDTTYDEDRSQIRKRNGPQVMALLRNLAISLLRLARAASIASATRFLGRHVEAAARLIGLR
jgi:hypothetical protein